MDRWVHLLLYGSDARGPRLSCSFRILLKAYFFRKEKGFNFSVIMVFHKYYQLFKRQIFPDVFNLGALFCGPRWAAQAQKAHF